MLAHVKEGIPGRVLRRSFRHGRQGFFGDKDRSEDSFILTNINTERSADRYEIDPLELLKVEKEAVKEGSGRSGLLSLPPGPPG